MTHRTAERISQTGEVFTPISLVNEILDKLPPKLFTDPTKTFLDNSCGEGAFLVEVLKRKLANGHSPEQALQTIFGVELMPDNHQVCQNNLMKVIISQTKDITTIERCFDIVQRNIVNHDALTYDYSFDGAN